MRNTDRWGWWTRQVLPLALATAGVACGGGEDSIQRATGDRMQPRESRQAARATAATSSSAPSVEAVHLEPPQPGAGEPVRARVVASDPDGDALSFGFVWTLNGRRLSGGGPQVSLSQSHKGDRLGVTVTASDGRAKSAPFEASAQVGNRAPILRGLRIEPGHNITAGGRVTVRPDATDSDGDVLSFRYDWSVNDHAVAGDGPALSTRGLRRGDRIRVAVVATDGEDDSNRIESIEITVANAMPVIVSEPGAPDETGVFRYQVRAEDSDGDRNLRFSLTTAPEGMTLDSLFGELAWTPRDDQHGVFPVEIRVEDLQGGWATQRFEVTVGAGEPEAPPASPTS